jgi:hypothetical protein
MLGIGLAERHRFPVSRVNTIPQFETAAQGSGGESAFNAESQE